MNIFLSRGKKYHEQQDYYHAFNHGAHAAPLFHDKEDFERFLVLLHIANNAGHFILRDMKTEDIFATMHTRALVDITAYCLLPDRYHIILRDRQPNGARHFIHKVGTAYVMYYNRKYNHKGTVFAGTYRARRVPDQSRLYELIGRIHLYPFSVKGNGDEVVQETRGWDENTAQTFSQRVKESSHDYRYFPDPDLPKLIISEITEFSADKIKKDMPELPWDKRTRLIRDFSMTAKEVAVFVEVPIAGNYFESVTASLKDNKDISRLSINYILSDYLGLIKKDHDEDYESFINSIEPSNFTKLMKMISENKVSSRGAKDILVLMYKGDKREPLIIAEEKGLLQKSDAGELELMVREIITKNPSVVADYKSGKLVALQFLIGQGMKLSKGSANPEVLKKVFLKELQ
jgi:hypothetical protein